MAEGADSRSGGCDRRYSIRLYPFFIALALMIGFEVRSCGTGGALVSRVMPRDPRRRDIPPGQSPSIQAPPTTPAIQSPFASR